MRETEILDGRYRLDEKLAEGGFGAIYRATDLVMEREVALKILHRELMGDPSVVERFNREASALARLHDPHTVMMYDVGIAADGTRYIVMELLRGHSLYVELREQERLPWRRAVAIARGVCSSLREAHAIGIIHRDLKPANIHLECYMHAGPSCTGTGQHALESDYVKLLDFGIAKMLDTGEVWNPDLTLAGQMIGTFDYMPPEQLIGGGCTDRSDVFSLGVVLYEMIAGTRPFAEAKGPTSMLMALLAGAQTTLAQHAEIPAALDELVMRMLSRDPEDRIEVVELDEQLAQILATAALEDEATFGVDDSPTWIEAVAATKMTLIGMVAPETPVPGTPASPRTPILDARPSGQRITWPRGVDAVEVPVKRITPSRGVLPPMESTEQAGASEAHWLDELDDATPLAAMEDRITPPRGVDPMPAKPTPAKRITPARGFGPTQPLEPVRDLEVTAPRSRITPPHGQELVPVQRITPSRGLDRPAQRVTPSHANESMPAQRITPSRGLDRPAQRITPSQGFESNPVSPSPGIESGRITPSRGLDRPARGSKLASLVNPPFGSQHRDDERTHRAAMAPDRGAELARGSELVIGAQLIISSSELKPSRAHIVLPANEPLPPPTSQFAVGSGSELEPSPSTRTDFAIRIATPPHARSRLANGTTPIVTGSNGAAASPTYIRYVLIAMALFGIGFGVALTIASLG